MIKYLSVMVAVEQGRACECCKSLFTDKAGKDYTHEEPGEFTCHNCWMELTLEEKKVRSRADKKTL